MTPCLRVIIPAGSLTETPRGSGGAAHSLIYRGDNCDYITEDPTENKAIPAAALYAARMDARGVITVVRGRNVALTPDHTYAGWPVPA